MPTFRTTFTPYPQTRPLVDGDVEPATGSLVFLHRDPIIGAYREMVRDLAYDVAELAPTTYLLARAAGVPITGIPVFTKRKFHHGDIRCAAGSGLREPADLRGRRVGVRAYSVTTGVWVRGLLSDDHGVASSSVSWVTDDEEHVASYTAPPNVSRAPEGQSLVAMLVAGDIDAALTGNAGIGRTGKPREGWRNTAAQSNAARDNDPVAAPYPLFDDPEPLERDWYARTGIYPIHAMITLREDVVAAHPGLPTELYRAFAAAKAKASVGRDELVAAAVAGSAVPADEDPIPYGVEANRRSLEALVRYATEQDLLTTPVTVESMFAPGDYPTA